MTALASKLLRWYDAHGRKTLPWRIVRSPYRTLVSEFMLQQTQVERVVPKFEAFVQSIPDVAALAATPSAQVLRLWKGLGYNSRAIRLRRVAQATVERHGGVIPQGREQLLALHGVGPYTAAAIRAFGYDIDDAPLDTNVRRIVHRVHFGVEAPHAVPPALLDERARTMAPPAAAHDWNSALMDLGSSICTARAPRCFVCPLRDYCAASPVDAVALERARTAAAKRSPQQRMPFESTTRYARGRIVDRLRALEPGGAVSLLDLHGELGAKRTLEELERLVAALERDGVVSTSGGRIRLGE